MDGFISDGFYKDFRQLENVLDYMVLRHRMTRQRQQRAFRRNCADMPGPAFARIMAFLSCEDDLFVLRMQRVVYKMQLRRALLFSRICRRRARRNLPYMYFLFEEDES